MDQVDLVVIGAGPGGLTAARTAAERGLRVVLVEGKKSISKITRTCAQIFYLTHIGSGQAYIGQVKVEIGKDNRSRFLFPDIGLSVDYNGILRACYYWRNLSPNGACAFTARNKLWGFVYDKGVLLKGLMDEVEKLGVTVMKWTRALNAENTLTGVKVHVRDNTGKESDIEAKNVIVANGINSRIVENLGLNKERKPLGSTVRVYGYIMEGVDCPYAPSTWVTFMYPSITPFINVWMGPMAEGTWQLGATARMPDSPVAVMNTFLKSSNFVPWFKNANIVQKSACVITPRNPIAEPVVGNIVIIGDAAAPAETWNQGAMACGYQAVEAIQTGDWQKYVDWWTGAFHFNSIKYWEDFAKYPALNMFFNDDDLNYFYGMMDGQLVDSIVEEVIKNAERVRIERPDIYEKIKKIPGVSL